MPKIELLECSSSNFSVRLPTLSTFLHPGRKLRWRNVQLLLPQPPTGLRPWLLDPGSLTAKLTQLSAGQFSVQVLRQYHGRARLDEAIALGISPMQVSLIREVLLMGHGEPWVFARSILPLTSLTGRLRQLRKQGNRPLGAFLFNQPHLQRSPIALGIISRHHDYVPAMLMGSDAIWGRRSVFLIDHKPLLVSEVFLDHFPENIRRLQPTCLPLNAV